MKEYRIVNSSPKKKWKLICKSGRYSTMSKEYDHEPTSEEVEQFMKIGRILGEVKLEIFYA